MVLLLFLPREGERDNTHSFFASKRIDGGQKMWEVNFKLQPTIDYIHKQLHQQCDDTNHNQTLLAMGTATANFTRRDSS